MTCRISSRKVERNEADAAFPQDMYVTNRRKNPFRQTRKKTDCPDAPDARLVPSALPDTGHGKDECFWDTKKDGAPRTAFQSREEGGRYARPRLYSEGSPAGSVCGGGAGEDSLFVQQPAAWKSFSRFFIRMKISVCPVLGISLAG